jgi:hypothetical protein
MTNRPFSWLAAVVLACSFGAAPVSAHPEGHGPINIPVSKEIASQLALSEVIRLSMEGKIDQSWRNNANQQSADLRELDGARQWIVIFQNPGEFEASKRTLYVFLSEYGDYIAANFSGK